MIALHEENEENQERLSLEIDAMIREIQLRSYHFLLLLHELSLIQSHKAEHSHGARRGE